MRAAGWLLIAVGALFLLYVVYVVWFTGLGTEREQSSLLEEWQREVGDPGAQPHDEGADAAQPHDEGANAAQSRPSEAVGSDDGTSLAGEQADGGEPEPAPADADLGGAVAVLEFRRPGAGERPVATEPLAVVDDVSFRHLQRGPGHYPTTAEPGEDGNFAVAGHRVTYAAPFYRLDELREGDEIHVTDRSGQRWVYALTETRIVSPEESWVLESDPLGTGAPTITLTTCHPRYSARQRLIAFGELVS